MKVAGWGKRFEFGQKYVVDPLLLPWEIEEENLFPLGIGTYEDPATYSSCMTTQESPIGARFKSCDTKEVF